jgi:predicted small secreted protein
MRNNFLLIILALILTASFLGCNTLKGAGEDIEGAGKSIQKTVDKNS